MSKFYFSIPEAVSRIGSLLDRVVYPMAVIVVPFCGFLILVLGFWLIAAVPSDIRGVECNVLFTIQKALTDTPLYTSPSHLPYDVAQYSPFFYIVCISISQALNLSPANPIPICIVARSVSLGCSILAFTVLYNIQVRDLRVPRCFAIVATIFAFAVCSPWLFLARPDALMYCFVISSISFLLKAERFNGRRHFACIAISAILALAAIAAKQNGAVTVVILLTSLLLSGRRRDFFVCATIVFCAGVLISLICVGMWPSLSENIVDGVNNGIDLENAIKKTYGRTLNMFSFPLALGVIIVLNWAKLTYPERTLAHNLLIVTIPLMMISAIVSGLKVGSAEGYFNETLIFSSVASCWFLSSQYAERDGVFCKTVACFLLLFMPFWTGSQWYEYYWNKTLPATSFLRQPVDSFSSQEYRSTATYVRQKMNRHPGGLVISWELPMNNFLPQYCILPQKEVLFFMYQQGVVDFSEFKRCVHEGRIKYGISRGKKLPRKLFGIQLPTSKVEFQEGSLRVFRFEER